MRKLLCILTILVGAAGSFAQGKRDVAVQKRIQRLIGQLGAEKFADREQATERLLRIGVQALPALVEVAKKARDKEIRTRAVRIARIVRQNDFKDQLAIFLKGKSDGKRLAGWKKFKTLAGDKLHTRRLFVQMLRAQPKLFQHLQAGNLKAVVDELNIATSRAATKRQFGETVEVGPVAALLFVAGDPKIELDATTSLVLSSNLCFVPSVQTTIIGGAKKSIIRKLIAQVIKRNGATPAEPYWMMLAMDHKIAAEGLEAALRILKNKPAALSAEFALLALAKYGDRKHASLAASFIGDSRRVQIRNVQILGMQRLRETQVGDVALATAVLLEKRDLAKFGMSKVMTHRTRVLDIRSLGFVNRKARDAAKMKFAMRPKR